MKKKFLSFILVFVFIFVGSLCLTACGKNDNDINNNQPVLNMKINYIKNLQLNSTSNTAYGIKKSVSSSEIPAQKVKHSHKNESFINLNSVTNVSHNQSNNEKYYLYSTSQNYLNGDVEYDEGSVQKVTFKKNTEITEDVYDDKGNLIPSNKTITQDEIDAQINKLYVTEKYMFMQFIPLVFESGNYNYYDGDVLKSEYLEVRPTSLTFDLNGASDFDSKNYYSSSLSQSFVIDNMTGYIYKLENFKINSIIDTDIVKDNDNNFYKMSIGNDGSLIFTDLMPNKDIQIANAITDKYGFTFVYNGVIDQIDTDNKIIYTKNRYLYDENKTVYSTDSMFKIQKACINGNWQDVDSDLTCQKLTYFTTSSSDYLRGYYRGKGISNFIVHSSDAGGIIGMVDSITLSYDITVAKWWDNESVITSKDNFVYAKVFNLDECYNTHQIFNLESFTKISEEPLYKYSDKYYINVGSDKKQIDNVYYKNTLTGTSYYQLVRNGDTFELHLLEDKNYTQNIFIFQPINKI